MSTSTHWAHDGSIDTIGGLSVFLAFVVAAVCWLGTKGVFNAYLSAIGLLVIATLGMRLASQTERREVKEFRAEAYRRCIDSLHEEELVNRCSERATLRARVRSGDAEDDGLSSFGQEVAKGRERGDYWVASMKKDRELGGKFPSETEDLFGSEKSDSRVLAAWKKKLDADENWKRILSTHAS